MQTCLWLLKSVFWEVPFASPCIFATRASKNQLLTHSDRFFLTGTAPEYSWVVNLQLDDIYCLFNPTYVPGTSVHHWILTSIPHGNDFYQHPNSERLRNLSRDTQLWMGVQDLAFKSISCLPCLARLKGLSSRLGVHWETEDLYFWVLLKYQGKQHKTHSQ